MSVTVWTLVAVAWVAVFAGCMVGWRLRGSVQVRGRGGMLDLTPAPGELDLDWSDPRDQLSEERRLRLVAEFTRPFRAGPESLIREYVGEA